jgi:uncharacterized RDD family membrane protein YckC
MPAAATCDVCARETPAAWERCGHCGAQRLLGLDGAVAGYRRYAGFWRRSLAVVLDLVLVAGPFALVLWLLPHRERLDLAGVGAFAVILYGLALPAWRGDTWGKRIVRAHLVEDDGAPIGRGRVSAREGVGKILEAIGLLLVIAGIATIADGSRHDSTAGGIVLILFGSLGPLGILLTPFDRRRRALHDRMAGTVCVRGRPVAHPPRFGERG